MGCTSDSALGSRKKGFRGRKRFSPEEDALILSGAAEGKSWPDVTEMKGIAPGRIPNAIRARYIHLQSRSLDQPPSLAVSQQSRKNGLGQGNVLPVDDETVV